MKKYLLLGGFIMFLFIQNISSETPKNVYGFSAVTMQGENKKLSDYKGKVILIVNTASKCGFTPQFAGLEALYKKYKDKGLEILGFPSNQFASQDPGTNKEIAEFCQLNYGVTFQMFEKIDVNGKDAHPLYKYLVEQKKTLLGKSIKWNFTKFLVNKNGEVVARFSPQTTPADLEKEIEGLL
jgi:glutathione peroxidase